MLYETRCPRCNRTLQAACPAKVRDVDQPLLTALIGALSSFQRDSRRTVQEVCPAVTEVPTGRAPMQGAVDRVSKGIMSTAIPDV